MVGTPPATVPTVEHLHDTLIARKRRWLTAHPHVAVSFTALAETVHEILTVALAAGRAVNEELIWEIVLLEAELADARAERDQALVESEHRETEIIALTVERDQALAAAGDLESELDMVRAERDGFGRALSRKGALVVHSADLDIPGGEVR